jgi:Methyltransferase domain
MGAERQELAQYCHSGRNKVHGWLNAVDAELFLQILSLQDRLGIVGATAEIGVHHGKSFIPLCLGLRNNERALCVDVFEDQGLNEDRSGEGSREVFEKNLRRFSIPKERVVVIKGSSLEVKADQILDAVGRVRFFSVDGGHWRDIVVNDLSIAANTVGEDGIIALDDFLHKEWPDVTRGFFEWHAGAGTDFGPLAISPGKLYLAKRKKLDMYSDQLFSIASIRPRIIKYCDFLDHRVPILSQRYPSFVLAMKQYLENASPELYQQLLRYKRKMF